MICRPVHLAACIALVIVTSGVANADQEITEKQPVILYKYCGRNLVTVLNIICDSMYNKPKGYKIQLPTELALEKFRVKRDVVDVFTGGTRRVRRGAYDDCCRKGCTLEEMIGYCGGY